MHTSKFLVFILLLNMAFSCGTETPVHTPNPINLKTEEKSIQDAIQSTQQLLIGKLITHIDSNDFEPAIRFCAENAQRLTDSISKELGYDIRRISPKNRNEKNAASKIDWNAYHYFEKTKSSGQMAKSYFNELNQIYYAPIVLGMPVCLKCHGNEQERDRRASVLIQELYPRDRAVDYAQGDLRGVWRVAKK
jgi:hypothetical protein